MATAAKTDVKRKAAAKKATRPAVHDVVKKSGAVKDFSVVENGTKASLAIRAIAGSAGVRAAASAKAMGLPKTYATQTAVVRVSADGKFREVVSTPAEGRKVFFKKYAKGTVLHARKK